MAPRLSSSPVEMPVDVEGLVGQQGLEVATLDRLGATPDAVVALARIAAGETRSGCRAHRRARRFSSSARLAVAHDGLILQSHLATGADAGLNPDDAAVDDGRIRTTRVAGQQLASSLQIRRAPPIVGSVRRPSSRSRTSAPGCAKSAPVRAIPNTASSNNRLFAVRPGSPTFPGKCGATLSDCSKLNILLSMAHLPFGTLYQNFSVMGIGDNQMNVIRP